MGECWCCGRERTGPYPHRGLCSRCYKRWYRHGFTGAGPGPEREPIDVRALTHATIITRLSAREAAARIGVTRRTVCRWRAILRVHCKQETS